MGIQGLLPFVQNSTTKVNISEFLGCTVAIDAYCWLHKGAFSCAEKLARGEKTNQYVIYCMKYVNMLLSHNIKPILVFDGCHLPAKADTEKNRRERREANRKRAGELLRLDRGDEARTLLRRSVDVTHDMAHSLIVECRNRNVDCIVAPFEADAQLAYLNISGIAHLVVTEDSDLMLFGCNRVVFKMDVHGNGLLVEQNKLPLSMKMRPDNFNLDKFRNMCILSGCDYLPSLPGIGLQKALKFIKQTAETDIIKILPKLGMYLNIPGIMVTEEYKHGFEQAMAMFKHQTVFDPRTRKLVPLTPLPVGAKLPLVLPHSEDTFYQIALGNLDPISLCVVDNWSPDNQIQGGVTVNSRGWNARAKHPSIWTKDFTLPNPEIPHPPKDPRIVTKSTTFGKQASVHVDVLEERLIERKLSLDESIEVFTNICEESPPHKKLCSQSTDKKSDDEEFTTLDELFEKNNTPEPVQSPKGLLAKMYRTEIPNGTIKSKYFFNEPEKPSSPQPKKKVFSADEVIKRLIQVGNQDKGPEKVLSPIKGSIYEISDILPDQIDSPAQAKTNDHGNHHRPRNLFSVTKDDSTLSNNSNFFGQFLKTSKSNRINGAGTGTSADRTRQNSPVKNIDVNLSLEEIKEASPRKSHFFERLEESVKQPENVLDGRSVADNTKSFFTILEPDGARNSAKLTSTNIKDSKPCKKVGGLLYSLAVNCSKSSFVVSEEVNREEENMENVENSDDYVPQKNPFSVKSNKLKSPSGIFGKRKVVSPVKDESCDSKQSLKAKKLSNRLVEASLFRWTKPLDAKSEDPAINLLSDTPPNSQESDSQERLRLPKVPQYLGASRRVGIVRKRGSSGIQKNQKTQGSLPKPTTLLTMYGFKQKEKIKTSGKTP